jgi:hypothetical protein
MELCSALSGRHAKERRPFWFPFFQGDYWEDGTVFDLTGELKKDDHLIPILSGQLLGIWN